MYSQEELQDLSTIQLAYILCQDAGTNIALMEESLFLLTRKRRTLEEKAIANYFHSLIGAYSRLITLLHSHMSKGSDLDDALQVTFDKLRTVNEKVRTWVNELLKIVKYDLNFLEQYFEYDYCYRLLNEETMLSDLEAVLSGTESELG